MKKLWDKFTSVLLILAIIALFAFPFLNIEHGTISIRWKVLLVIPLSIAAICAYTTYEEKREAKEKALRDEGFWKGYDIGYYDGKNGEDRRDR